VLLGSPSLNTDRLSADPRLLLLLIGMLLLEQGFHTWFWCDGLYRDRRDGQECQSVLWRRSGGDGDSRGHHVAPSGGGGRESGAPPFTRGCATLIRGLLEDGVQTRRPVVHHTNEYGA
jgi:hypothetical protein